MAEDDRLKAENADLRRQIAVLEERLMEEIELCQESRAKVGRQLDARIAGDCEKCGAPLPTCCAHDY